MPQGVRRGEPARGSRGLGLSGDPVPVDAVQSTEAREKGQQVALLEKACLKMCHCGELQEKKPSALAPQDVRHYLDNSI